MKNRPCTPVPRFGGLAVFAAFMMSVAPAWAQPANDNFSSSRWMGSVASFNVSVNAELATSQPGETVWSAGYGTIWFSWQAPSTGIATFLAVGQDTFGGNALPAIRIGQGDSLAALAPAGHSHQASNLAKVRIPVLAGQTYRIQVENGSNSGRWLTLALNDIAPITDAEFGVQWGAPYIHAFPQANNSFAGGAWLVTRNQSGAWIYPDRFSATASGFQATSEPGETTANSNYGTVWFNWVAPRTGIATFQARGRNESNQPTVPYLRVWQGSQVTSLAMAGDAKRTNIQAQMRIPVQAGQLYRIQVENGYYYGQTVTLNLTGIAAISDPEFGVQADVPYVHVTPKANDNFANGAWMVTRNSSGAWIYPDRFSATASSVQATSEQGETFERADHGTVWFNWVAPRTGIATFEALGRNIQHELLTPKIRIGQGTSVSALPLAGVSRNVAGVARVQIPVQAGQFYRIQVENGYYYGQTVTLNLTGITDITNPDFGVLAGAPYIHVRPLANDNFAAGAWIVARNSSGAWVYPDRFSATASSGQATTESGEKFTRADYGTVWFRWVAPRTGIATFEALGRTISHERAIPVIRVGQGASVSELPVAGQSRAVSGVARLQIPVEAGQTYHIQVENAWYYSQTVTLRLTGIADITSGDFGVQSSVPYLYVRPGANDDYNSATPIITRNTSNTAWIHPDRFSATASTWESTAEAGEPVNYSLGSVWFRWVAPRSGTATFEASGRYSDHSLMTPQLRVGQGSGIEGFALSPGTSSTVNQRARYVLNVSQGQTYHIQVANAWYYGQTATLNLVSLR
jgi:hypothetical protein